MTTKSRKSFESEGGFRQNSGAFFKVTSASQRQGVLNLGSLTPPSRKLQFGLTRRECRLEGLWSPISVGKKFSIPPPEFFGPKFFSFPAKDPKIRDWTNVK